jgi:catechol 2,3-dioxygenase-like lactoylglutathione lyase family enzyme
MSEVRNATRITEVGCVIVPVTDQDRALEFYVDKLGFEKRTDAAYGMGFRWLEVAPPGAQTTIAIVPPQQPDHAQPGIDTNVSLTTQDIDADYADLKARGVEFEGEIMRMGDDVPPMAFFSDQDGNRFLLVQRH